MPEPVAVTKPPHHTRGNVAHANTQAQRWGQRESGVLGSGDGIDFGFWILDFGLEEPRFSGNPKSKI
jgi:hypothetical protein